MTPANAAAWRARALDEFRDDLCRALARLLADRDDLHRFDQRAIDDLAPVIQAAMDWASGVGVESPPERSADAEEAAWPVMRAAIDRARKAA